MRKPVRDQPIVSTAESPFLSEFYNIYKCIVRSNNNLLLVIAQLHEKIKSLKSIFINYLLSQETFWISLSSRRYATKKCYAFNYSKSCCGDLKAQKINQLDGKAQF